MLLLFSSMPSEPFSDMIKVMEFFKFVSFQQVGRFASPFTISISLLRSLM